METLAEVEFEDFFPSCREILQKRPDVQYIDLTNPVKATADVVLTGCDKVLDELLFRAIDSPTVRLWLSHNNGVDHPKVKSLPVLPDYSTNPCSLAHVNGNSLIIAQKRKEPKSLRNWVYAGFRDSTNPDERSRLRELFNGKPEVTFTPYDRSEKGYATYVDHIYNHRFVLSPAGNGVDCMRTWESLYLRSIPIVKRHPVMCFAEHLPILFVDNWEEAADLSYLEQRYEDLMAKRCDFSILQLSYWLNLVKNCSNSSA